MDQQIHYCRTSDGVNIAYATAGRGQPVVFAGWSQIERNWNHVGWTALLGPLCDHYSVTRFDERGHGLSQRDVEDVSIGAWVRDLEAVIDAQGIERCALIGLTQGVATAIAYTSRHPQRVSRLALYGGFVSQTLRPADPRARVAMREMIRPERRMGTAALASIIVHGASAEELASFENYQATMLTGEMAARYFEVNDTIDLRPELSKLDVPCAVLHRLDDVAVNFDNAREIAAGIRGARLIPLSGTQHVPFTGDVAELAAALVDFLDDTAELTEDRPKDAMGLSSREREVLTLVARGSTNQQVADALVISPSTVDRHVSNLYSKIGAHNRAEATLWAVAHGLLAAPTGHLDT